MNNITVDGSYFNNSFGLGGQPGDRTNVAPISIEAIEQVQVSIAPYDVRQGNFVGAGVNTVTRSGTNRFAARPSTSFRDQDFVGTEAQGPRVQPGHLRLQEDGCWAGGPIVKNKLFVFGNCEDEKSSSPCTTFRANSGGEAVGGNITRVLASDLNTLAHFLKTNFSYDTGPYQDLTTYNTRPKRGSSRSSTTT